MVSLYWEKMVLLPLIGKYPELSWTEKVDPIRNARKKNTIIREQFFFILNLVTILDISVKVIFYGK